jgi:hypothetical protein
MIAVGKGYQRAYVDLVERSRLLWYILKIIISFKTLPGKVDLALVNRSGTAWQLNEAFI